jgi:NAD(P)-dependent dehydrogenase (short-subunit alcohol dehydrogenase family)
MTIQTDHLETGAAAALQGQTAIVTGAGRGVGRAVAIGLAAAGASVAAAARSRDELGEVVATIEAAGGRAAAVPTDVTDAVAVEELAAAAAALGPVTLLVNNAGSWGQVGPVAGSDAELWWRDVEVNLRGTYLCTRAVLPAMLAAGRGRIVNVSSYAAVAARPYLTAYASSKAAVLRFTDSLAGELEGTGVLAFAITPGLVRTQLLEGVTGSDAGRRFLPELGERDDVLEPERAAALVAEIAAGRLDPLAGRFVHVLDDVGELLRRADEIAGRDLYTLRLGTLSA